MYVWNEVGIKRQSIYFTCRRAHIQSLSSPMTMSVSQELSLRRTLKSSCWLFPSQYWAKWTIGLACMKYFTIAHNNQNPHLSLESTWSKCVSSFVHLAQWKVSSSLQMNCLSNTFYTHFTSQAPIIIEYYPSLKWLIVCIGGGCSFWHPFFVVWD